MDLMWRQIAEIVAPRIEVNETNFNTCCGAAEQYDQVKGWSRDGASPEAFAFWRWQLQGWTREQAMKGR
jgi:hypothetical protein